MIIYQAFKEYEDDYDGYCFRCGGYFFNKKRAEQEIEKIRQQEVRKTNDFEIKMGWKKQNYLY